MRVLTSSLRARLERPAWWAWSAVGLVGSLVVAAGAAGVGALPRPGRYRWWLPVLVHEHASGYGLLYLGVALLVVAWLGLGFAAARNQLGSGRGALTLAAWALPLFVAPPLFSRDVYSYVAQGLLAHRGLNPYHFGPDALGAGPLFDSLATAWRHTPSPYGPLFVTLSNVIVGPAHSLIAQVLAFRALSGIGLLASALLLVRLARELGANESLALWLGALSPLSLFSSVASAHNDSLMIALVLGGLLAWRRGHLHVAIGLIALGAAVKLPALAGLAVITGAEWRRGPGRLRLLTEVVLVTGVVLTGLTLLNGFGFWWASPPALALASQLRTLATPMTSLGVFLAASLRVLGAHTLSTHRVVSDVQPVGELVSTAAVLYALWRVRATHVVRTLGVILLVLVLGGPTLWPWYLLWGITLLAATAANSSRVLIAIAGLASLVVGPGGSPMLGGNAYLVTAPLLVIGLIGFMRYLSQHDILATPDDAH